MYNDMKATKFKDLKGNTIRSDNAIVGRSYMHGSGTIVKEYPKTKPCKSMCGGCRDDFYNDHNPMGVPECWGFKTARVVDKVGHSTLHVQNGPNTIMQKTLSCWHAVSK